jgi:Sec-independent protein translocase protein TatA
MENINVVAIVVAVVGAGGFGVFVREIADVVTKVRNGVSAKESKRKNDLVAQRDYEYRRAESEARNRRRMEEYAARLRRALVEANADNKITPWPVLEDTLTREEANQAINDTKE